MFGNYYPDFNVRLSALISVVASIFELNKNGWLVGNSTDDKWHEGWQFSWWRPVANDSSSFEFIEHENTMLFKDFRVELGYDIGCKQVS